jgi:hypothetical protein
MSVFCSVVLRISTSWRRSSLMHDLNLDFWIFILENVCSHIYVEAKMFTKRRDCFFNSEYFSSGKDF